MIHKLKEDYKNKSIQGVILLTFSMVSIVSFLILAVVFTYSGKNLLENFAREKNEQQMEVLAEGVEREYRQAINFLDTVHYKIIKKSTEEGENAGRFLDFICEENKDIMGDVLIFRENGTILYENHQDSPLILTEGQKEEMFKNGRQDVGKTWFSRIPQTKDLLMYRIVEIKDAKAQYSAVLAGTLRYERIVRGLQAHGANDESYFYMKTQDGALFYHPKELQMEHGIYKETIGREKDLEDGSWVVKADHKRYLVHQRAVGYTGWKLVGVSSLDHMLYNDYPIGFMVWSLIILVGILTAVINHYIVKRITGPIKHLSAKVEAFGDGNMNVEIQPEGTYEIRKLSQSFLDMQEKIREFMKQEVQKEQEYWSMQMRLLQSQINPHFLYNTLDSIIWMIQSKRYDGAARMVTALAGFFRISLNKGEDFITVGKEVTHVQNYMEIQGIRFEDKFSFEIHCDEAIKECMCPKLIIQPLAENAVYHGMEGMYGDGEIEISAYEHENLIYIDVTDNGEGMSEEQIQNMMFGNVVSSKRGSGIGVKNVNERLKYCFGREYGIRIISEIDEGTTVRICIPKVEDLNEYWKKEKNFSGDYDRASGISGYSSVERTENKDDHTLSSSSKGI